MYQSGAGPRMRLPEIPLWAVAAMALGPIGIAVILGLGAVGLRSCQRPVFLGGDSGAAVTATQELLLHGTTDVALAAPANLVISLGEPEALRIEATPSALAHLTTDVSANRLVIGTRGRVRGTPKLHLTVKRLDSLTLATSGDVVAPDLKGEEVRVTLAGSGDLRTGAIEARRVRLELASSGNTTIQGVRATTLELTTVGSGEVQIGGGEVEEQRLVINGSGDYAAGQLRSARTTVAINGSGSLLLWARDSLDATIKGSGDIAYRGHPKVQQRILGSGSITSLGD
jgi:hypothetical protein